MILTKEQQAQQYADKRMARVYSLEWDSIYVKDLIEEAFEDGYTAAEQSQWRSVEEELPEEGQAIIIRVVHKDVKSGKIFESYFNTFYFKQYGFEIEERPQRGKISKVTHWKPKPDLPIPSLPYTNTEKQ